MAFDGLNLVMSRVALLDIFLMFFILLSIYFLIINNLWLSGSAIGLAISIKWSAAFLIPLVILFVVIYNKVTFRNLYKVVSQFTLLPISIYFASWSGWIFSSQGWARQSESNVFASLWNYHLQILDFHQGLDDKHAYQANPWSWLIMGRPTSFFYASPQGCEAKDCAQEVLALGTPILWWVGTIAFAVVIGYWIKSLILRHSDSALNIVVLGIAAGYLPWFAMQQRTAFSFYAIIFEPFMIVAIVYCAKLLLDSGLKPVVSQSIVGGIFALILLCFLFFIPLFTGQIITYEDWRLRMWFDSWI